jgi:hypothetical protein
LYAGAAMKYAGCLACLGLVMSAACSGGGAAPGEIADAAAGGGGGRGGAAGGAGGQGGAGGGSADARAVADAGGAADLGAGKPADADPGSPRGSLDECFADLVAALKNAQPVRQIDTKVAADGSRMRLALEVPPDLAGLATPWRLARFGLEREGRTLCVTERAQLEYTVTHHNCKDSARVTAEGVRYEISGPDQMGTTVSASMGATRLWGPLGFTSTSCASSLPGGRCLRGGGACPTF